METPRETEQQPPPAAEHEARRYARILWERRRAVLLVLVAGAAAFALWAWFQPRVYQATATIVVDRTPPQVLGGEVRDVVQVGPGNYYQMQDYIQTQRRVLKSDRLARKAVEALHLLGDKAFWGGRPPGDLEATAQRFAGAVDAEAMPNTQILSVSFRHSDPAQARRAVDGLVDAFIASNEAWRDNSNENASILLANQSDDLRKRLDAAERALYDFKKKNDLLSVSLEERVNNVARQIDKLSDALTDARLRHTDRQAEAAELERMYQADPDEIAPASGGGQLEQLKAQLLVEERKLSELKARYEDPHPLVRQQTAKVKAMKAGVRQEIARLLRGAKARTDEAGEEEKQIAAQLADERREGLRISRLELDYNNLKRDADSLARQYNLVETRGKETELVSKIKANNLRVLDYARLPTAPVSPRLLRAGLLALLLTLLLAVAIALLLDALDSTFKGLEDVEHRLALPFLGMVPHVDKGDRLDLGAADSPTSPVAECCRVIRTNLLYAGLKQPLHRILITSSLAREGKTLTSINLGVVMAQAGNRVLLIEADLRMPRLQGALGLPRDIGLTDVLLGNVTLDEAVQPTGVPNLSVLLAGGVPPNPGDIIEGPRFRELLEACSERFDRVLLDSPPALPVADPAILAAMCDGVVLVVRSDRTSVVQARRARQIMADTGARMLGVILNDVGKRVVGYGYGYGYGPEDGERRASRSVAT